MYYLEVCCESQFESFIEYSNCGNLCRLGSCMSDAVTAQNKTCSLIEFQNSIMSNRNAWTAEMGTSEVDICCSDDVNSASLPFISVSLNLLSLFVIWWFSIIRRKPPSYNRKAPSYNRKAPSYNRKPPSYNRKPPSYNRKPPSYNKKAIKKTHKTAMANIFMMNHDPCVRVMILLLVLTVLPVCIYGDICTDSKKLEEIATSCATKDILSFYQSTTNEEKCGYLLNNVQKCVFDTVNATYDKVCSAKEQHQMIVDFKDEVQQFLQFDINLCIPPRSCSNIQSILYYLPVICESVYHQYVQTGNCR
ncbi:unnamed protein product [Mytilus edulis]|uniref:Uncharacterized protein n=1 Tax=Mytilus edulis TaxID=6550 RepID=A0A8S3USZ3_MYTED|nr:unnamed protein product [Mytilus edulis]